eukprot:gene8576-34011_t
MTHTLCPKRSSCTMPHATLAGFPDYFQLAIAGRNYLNGSQLVQLPPPGSRPPAPASPSVARRCFSLAAVKACPPDQNILTHQAYREAEQQNLRPFWEEVNRAKEEEAKVLHCLRTQTVQTMRKLSAKQLVSALLRDPLA